MIRFLKSHQEYSATFHILCSTYNQRPYILALTLQNKLYFCGRDAGLRTS